MKICDELSCTGCLVCADTCKMQAISVKKNRQGFSYPVINDAVCVRCGKCVSVCPVNIQKKNKAATTPLRAGIKIMKKENQQRLVAFLHVWLKNLWKTVE